MDATFCQQLGNKQLEWLKLEKYGRQGTSLSEGGYAMTDKIAACLYMVPPWQARDQDAWRWSQNDRQGTSMSAVGHKVRERYQNV